MAHIVSVSDDKVIVTFLIVKKAKVNRTINILAFHNFNTWLEEIPIPCKWTVSQIGIYKRDGLLFPLENLCQQRELAYSWYQQSL